MYCYMSGHISYHVMSHLTCYFTCHVTYDIIIIISSSSGVVAMSGIMLQALLSS